MLIEVSPAARQALVGLVEDANVPGSDAREILVECAAALAAPIEPVLDAEVAAAQLAESLGSLGELVAAALGPGDQAVMLSAADADLLAAASQEARALVDAWTAPVVIPRPALEAAARAPRGGRPSVR